ncbi:MAG: HAD family hydrolase [Burkholderiales bacterium]|nr:HAD family hydrolase [Burkholderiales bacterium]
MTDMWPRAILFDLDDTLFDHRRASAHALSAMHAVHAPDLPFEPFVAKHAEVLEIFHARFLAGEFTLDHARVARMQTLFAAFERDLDAATAIKAAQLYREGHQANRHLVPGTIELLDALREHCRLGVVTNNSTAEQIEKLRALNIAGYFETVVISEDVGVTKPDAKIFAIALERIGARPQDTVFVGDNWTNDIVGAINAGMSAVWLDHSGKTPATTGIAWQKCLESRADAGASNRHIAMIHSLAPVAEAIAAIKAAFKNRTTGAEHEQLETLAS